MALCKLGYVRAFKVNVRLLQTVQGEWCHFGIEGQADINGWLQHEDGRGLRLEIEVKTGGAVRTKGQKAWAETVIRFGCLYYLAHDVAGAVGFCEWARRARVGEKHEAGR